MNRRTSETTEPATTVRDTEEKFGGTPARVQGFSLHDSRDPSGSVCLAGFLQGAGAPARAR